MVSTIVFPVAYVVTTKRTFPGIGYSGFIIWFPLFYATLLMFSMAAMESETLYDAHRCMHCLVPSEETEGPTVYPVDDEKDEGTTDNPILT